MAGTTRLELATSAVTGQRSNQLNYVPSFFQEVDGMKLAFADKLLRDGPGNSEHPFALCEIIITEPEKTVSFARNQIGYRRFRTKKAKFQAQLEVQIPNLNGLTHLSFSSCLTEVSGALPQSLLLHLFAQAQRPHVRPNFFD